MRITHFICFSGETIEATADNYANDSARYRGVIDFAIRNSVNSAQDGNEHDAYAYSRTAYQYARIAAHGARMAIEKGHQCATS
jgi:hypothetical protein